MRGARGVCAAAAGLALLGAPAAAQEAAMSPSVILGADTSRAAPFHREYDMFAWVGDSIVPLGTRTVRMDSVVHAGVPAWLVVETRTGAVPAAESLYVARDLRPLQWSAAIGNARLAVAFGRDSIFGGTSGPGGRQTIMLPGGPSLVVSLAMLEAIFPLVDWSPYRSDSVSVLLVDHVSSGVIKAELAVIGEDSVRVTESPLVSDSVPHFRPAWIVALRAPARSVLFWIDRESGTLLRLQQPLPLNGASMLEYRLRPPAVSPAGVPSPASGW